MGAALAMTKPCLRSATSSDAAVVAHHRAAMFRDMGMIAAAEVPTVEEASRPYLARALADGEYLGWLLEDDGHVVAGGGVLLRRLLPSPGHLVGGEEAYVLNVYVEPSHRRRGAARLLMHTILDWSRARGIARVALHASDAGRSLYEDLGFTATNEMRLPLE